MLQNKQTNRFSQHPVHCRNQHQFLHMHLNHCLTNGGILAGEL